jgi:superfamily I DNA/RNA helicase
LKRQLILGPPGTGKTTTLLDIVDDCLRRGIRPDRIAYVSFTQKAAYEARDRAMERFNYTADDFPYFRTLHSLSSRMQGLKHDDFMHKKHYEEIGRGLGIPGMTGKKLNATTEFRNTNTGNHLLSMIDIARNKKMTLSEYKDSIHEIALFYAMADHGKVLKQLVLEIEDYKNTYGLRDFTDLIVDPVRLEMPPLDIDVAIIDEAQDLTAVQWDFVNHIFCAVKEMYIAGDDDQAIYEWNGADVDQFLRLEGARRVLNKSYRLPRRPWLLAHTLANRITQRYEKEWSHNGTEGEVVKADSYKVAHILEGGEWMVLARNKAHLLTIQRWLVNKGVPIRFSDYNVIDPDHMAAIHGWVDLGAGKLISGLRAKQLYEVLMTQKHVGYGGKARMADVQDDARLGYDDLRAEFALLADITTPWWEVMERIRPEKREYYRRCRQNGESLKNPRVTLSTIHGVKGGEADNVLLLPDMARQTYKMFSLGRQYGNEEHRVFYVGASRAKKRLFICGQQAQHAYPFPKFKEKAA